MMFLSPKLRNFAKAGTPLAILILAAGCGVITTYDEEGRTHTKYFQTQWDLYRASVDHVIHLESSGEIPPVGKQTWQEYWDWRITLIRQGSKDIEHKLDYIHAARRAANLPPID
jgi:hypothetical protein